MPEALRPFHSPLKNKLFLSNFFSGYHYTWQQTYYTDCGPRFLSLISLIAFHLQNCCDKNSNLNVSGIIFCSVVRYIRNDDDAY